MQLAVTIYPYCSLFNEDQVFASGDETRTPKGMADEPSRVHFYRAGVVVAERDVDVNSGSPVRGALEVCKYRSNLSRLRRCSWNASQERRRLKDPGTCASEAQ